MASVNPEQQKIIRKLLGASEGGPIPYGRLVWYFLFLLILLSFIRLSYQGYQEHIDKSRVYGKWTEVNAPSYATDVFYLQADGVKFENRYIARSFDFDGAIVSFYFGDTLYEYKVFGDNDERLKRVAGGAYAASFIKEGYEHTIKDKESVGRARRVSVAEHFQELKNK
ncbi:DUF2850 domain-containing protein [Vibrio sp. JC009]|uniref:DUF2850 domain-containing protein n=1 Tax=Vibrio sp. JC009 TaxID=2912314 RepID=UPI0023AE9123|nr:DUF2850 domain-containing protein [Vibrio sp. JC009]WED24793.1 DUF2850 domain-containing protein [Vibrio sp. JC009]